MEFAIGGGASHPVAAFEDLLHSQLVEDIVDVLAGLAFADVAVDGSAVLEVDGGDVVHGEVHDLHVVVHPVQVFEAGAILLEEPLSGLGEVRPTPETVTLRSARALCTRDTDRGKRLILAALGRRRR